MHWCNLYVVQLCNVEFVSIFHETSVSASFTFCFFYDYKDNLDKFISRMIRWPVTQCTVHTTVWSCVLCTSLFWLFEDACYAPVYLYYLKMLVVHHRSTRLWFHLFPLSQIDTWKKTRKLCNLPEFSDLLILSFASQMHPWWMSPLYTCIYVRPWWELKATTDTCIQE